MGLSRKLVSDTKTWGFIFTLRTLLFQKLLIFILKKKKAIFQNIKYESETQLMLLPRGRHIIKALGTVFLLFVKKDLISSL